MTHFTVTVPRLWPNGTIACLATGPSLTQEDVDAVRGKADGVIAISDAIDLAPWADVLYSCDGRWWTWRLAGKERPVDPVVKAYAGLKYALKDDAKKWQSHGVQMLRHTGRPGLELSPDGLRDGANSGYQAINLAVHMGAKRILLLGYDMHGDHFFGKHPDGTKPNFATCLSLFPGLVKPLAELGVSVVNCTKKTAIPDSVFPRASLSSVLAQMSERVTA